MINPGWSNTSSNSTTPPSFLVLSVVFVGYSTGSLAAKLPKVLLAHIT